MAVIRCLAPAEGLQGVVACLRESENLTGILVVAFLLIGWLAMQSLAEARRYRQIRERQPTMSAPPPFGSVRHADAVYTFANREFYQVMLAEMEKALFAAGYELTRDESRRMMLSDADRHEVSRRVFRVRQSFISPLLSEQLLSESADAAEKDGFSARWLSVLIGGSEQEGWYITRSKIS